MRAREDLRARVADVFATTWNGLALEVFAYQRTHNPVYRRWLELTGRLGEAPDEWSRIPCLPIELFRSQPIVSGVWEPEAVFRSSGTTGSATSTHAVRSLASYQLAARRSFERLVGPLHRYRLLALLPNYLSAGQSGLVAMVDGFLRVTRAGSGYFLSDHAALRQNIRHATERDEPVLLWGVSFALLDVIEAAGLVLPQGSLVVETGGMKGRRRELTRTELHERLRASIRVGEAALPAPICSEYGMTELQSQAYATAAPGFRAAPTLRVRARDVTDPGRLRPYGAAGALNLYDLANLDTCAFLMSEDLGRVHADGTFEVLGRLDNSVARGCNLLVGDGEGASPTPDR